MDCHLAVHANGSCVWPERLYVIHPTWCVPITKAVAVWGKPPSMNTLCFQLYEGTENDKESQGTHTVIKQIEVVISKLQIQTLNFNTIKLWIRHFFLTNSWWQNLFTFTLEYRLSEGKENAWKLKESANNYNNNNKIKLTITISQLFLIELRGNW